MNHLRSIFQLKTHGSDMGFSVINQGSHQNLDENRAASSSENPQNHDRTMMHDRLIDLATAASDVSVLTSPRNSLAQSPGNSTASQGNLS